MPKTTFLMLFFLISLSFASYSQTQNELITFNKERLKIQKTGMGILGVWAIGNITTGIIGYHASEGSVAQLHKMNALWNGVNLVLAVPGYLGASGGKYDLPFRKTYEAQQSVEKIYLFNTALDLAYVAGGLYLTERARHQTDRRKHDMNLGFGNSIMFQGAFLMLLDATMYFVHTSHRHKKLSGYLDKVIIGYNGVGFRHQF